jgi:hypothetical protein
MSRRGSEKDNAETRSTLRSAERSQVSQRFANGKDVAMIPPLRVAYGATLRSG